MDKRNDSGILNSFSPRWTAVIESIGSHQSSGPGAAGLRCLPWLKTFVFLLICLVPLSNQVFSRSATPD